jgi:hypothetical protein
MQKILAEAVALGNASARSLSFKPRRAEGFDYYDHPRSGWSNSLFVGGYDFTRPPPLVTKDGVKQFPETGARMLNARITMFYVATGITPAMVMRLTNIGSEYLVAQADSNNEPLDGAKTYRVTLSPNIPAAAFWSLTVYDNQSRSMLQTPQRFPRAGSQSYPTAAAVPEPDGSTVVYFGPQRPEHAKEGNWIQTMPNKGWFLMLRLYSPLQPFFDKTWRVGEIEEVK